MPSRPFPRLAIVGAGPVGLTLALLAARRLPRADITVFDARPADRDVRGDPRTLALALGSLQTLQRLGAWEAEAACPIDEVQVSQAPPAWGSEATVRLTARELGVPMLGAVVAYGPVVCALQAAWQQQVQARPEQLRSCWGQPVAALKSSPDGVWIGEAQAAGFDLAVVAEGGVFADQPRKGLRRDYGQSAWVGTVELSGAPAGTAFERFTRSGPLALLPLRSPPAALLPAAAPVPAHSGPGPARAALVWCVSADDDPVEPLDPAQRMALLNTLLPRQAGQVRAMGPLNRYALGLNAERSLVQGRVVRIGNAAQTLHPVAGQGLNLGLRDAHALVDAMHRTPGIDAALRRVEWQRAPDRWSMIATTDFLARSFTWGGPGVGSLRGLALAGLQRLGPLKAALARHLMYGQR
ncbi:MAG: FAD-dependent monooxygenase [Rubrivivax sp.]|jgi:2-octaprenyl-6-methoxyphenol hydroxylase